MNILIAANTTWYIHNFRSRLIAALIERGHLVTALAPRDEYVSRIEASGARHLHLELDRAGVNPLSELSTLAHLTTLLRREKPTLILTNTTKGNIFVSLAARLLGIPVVTNISGLGRAYIAGGWLKTITRQLYKMAMKHPRLIFFQNEDDRKEFTRGGIVDWDKTARLPGSGVDLERFAPAATRSAGPHFVFLLAARLLWDKGVGEFVQAARQVKSRFPETEFRLLGFLDVQNPSAIPRAVIESWETEGVVRYLGSTDEVRQYYADADCVVLPSYREGIPRTLLEGSSMGIPIITTDAIGCRDTIEDGKTGFLCKVKDAGDLAEKMERMILLTPEQRGEMGKAGRAKMVLEFDERIVIDRYLAAIEEIATTENRRGGFRISS